MDDHELVRRAVSGDDQALEALVRGHVGAVWRLARSFMDDDVLAEMAVQDTFHEALAHLDAAPGEADVGIWLLTLCHRACRDRLPLDRLRREEGRGEATDLRTTVRDAARRLPPDERDAFVLVDVVGCIREEAATIVGVPAPKMRSRVARAREKLAQALGQARRVATGE